MEHPWEVSPKVELVKGGFTLTIEAGTDHSLHTGAELSHFISQLKSQAGWVDAPVTLHAVPAAGRVDVTVPPGGCNRFAMLELD